LENPKKAHSKIRAKQEAGTLENLGGTLMKIRSRILVSALVAGVGLFGSLPAFAEGPVFKVDPSWPKQLPNNWIVGQIGGMTVDAQDHIWVFQRPRSLNEADRGATLTPPRSKCCVPAPSVVEFDAAGNVVQAWGGPGGFSPDWPESEHGIMVDAKNQVWLTGNSNKDGSLLKFSRDGKFLAKFGKQGPITNSKDTTQLGSTASIALDTATSLGIAVINAPAGNTIAVVELFFGAVISNSIVHHIPEPSAVLAEIVRIAKSGATLFIRDLLRPPSDEAVRHLVATYAGDSNAHQRSPQLVRRAEAPRASEITDADHCRRPSRAV